VHAMARASLKETAERLTAGAIGRTKADVNSGESDRSGPFTKTPAGDLAPTDVPRRCGRTIDPNAFEIAAWRPALATLSIPA
jgi:hypothetical protein